MRFLNLAASGLLFASTQNAHAVSPWGKIKNAFNDCKFSSQEQREITENEKRITPRLSDNFFGEFSEPEFNQKPWLMQFRYVVVVNKSATGASAQRMRIYEFGQLQKTVKVSTGREGFELRRKNPVCSGAPWNSYWSQTPTGFYTPKFLSRYHVSSSWDANMPFAVFYDVENGLALHQVNPSQASMLGKRASGGCTRQDANTAEEMFKKIEATEGAQVPMINVDGSPVLDQAGNIRYITQQTVYNSKTRETAKFNTYSALIIVEDVTK